MNVSFSLPVTGYQVLMHAKSTDWFLKRALHETDGLDIGRKFASSPERLLCFSYRVVVETSDHTSVPNSKLSPPLRACAPYCFREARTNKPTTNRELRIIM